MNALMKERRKCWTEKKKTNKSEEHSNLLCFPCKPAFCTHTKKQTKKQKKTCVPLVSTWLQHVLSCICYLTQPNMFIIGQTDITQSFYLNSNFQ